MKEIVLKLPKPLTILLTKGEQELYRIMILEKEIELGHELELYRAGSYVKGKKLDEEELKGKEYMLSCLQPF